MSWKPVDESYYPIWAPQPQESSSSYAMFRFYCFLQGDRSLQKVADFQHRSLSNLKHLSSRWEWRKRAAAFDFHMQQFHMDGVRKAVKDRLELLEQRRLAEAEILSSLANQLLDLGRQCVDQLRESLSETQAGSRHETSWSERRTIVGCIDTLSRTALHLFRAGDSVQTEAIINEPIFDVNPSSEVVETVLLEVMPEIVEGIFDSASDELAEAWTDTFEKASKQSLEAKKKAEDSSKLDFEQSSGRGPNGRSRDANSASGGETVDI